MRIILLTDVDKLGLRGDIVDVARGYARNYLLPRKMAEVATAAKVTELSKREAHKARHEAATGDQAQEIAGRLEQLELRFDVNAGPTGSLFGSVTATDIAERIWADAKIRVDRRKVQLPESIKRIGRYEVPIGIFEDVTANVRTLVVPEGGELPPEEPEPVVGETTEAAPEQPAAEAAPDEPVAAGAPEPVEAAAEEPVAELAAEPVEAAVETAPPGMPEAEPVDAVVEEAAAGTLGQMGEPESA
jgi:large subunit ribosomal protein L9